MEVVSRIAKEASRTARAILLSCDKFFEIRFMVRIAFHGVCVHKSVSENDFLAPILYHFFHLKTNPRKQINRNKNANNLHMSASLRIIYRHPEKSQVCHETILRKLTKK